MNSSNFCDLKMWSQNMIRSKKISVKRPKNKSELFRFCFFTYKLQIWASVLFKYMLLMWPQFEVRSHRQCLDLIVVGNKKHHVKIDLWKQFAFFPFISYKITFLSGTYIIIWICKNDCPCCCSFGKCFEEVVMHHILRYWPFSVDGHFDWFGGLVVWHRLNQIPITLEHGTYSVLLNTCDDDSVTYVVWCATPLELDDWLTSWQG